MISYGFSFQEFISNVINDDYYKIIKKAEQEANDAEKGSFSAKGAVKRRDNGSIRYSQQLGGLLFWLHSGTRPFELSEGDFLSLKPICEKLIEKKQLNPETLELFNK
jgi:hypothetical protein